MGQKVTFQEDTDRLMRQLTVCGVDEETIGHLSADIGDLTDALNTIVAALRQIAAGNQIADAIDAIESEAVDHMPGHIKSLGKAAPNLRKALGISD